jgi:hypothetical protein
MNNVLEENEYAGSPTFNEGGVLVTDEYFS